MARPIPTLVEVEEATLTLEGLEETPQIPAPRVTLPTPMLGYQCNLQGCCCGGWRIPFRTDDLVRLRIRLDDADKATLFENMEMQVELGPDGERTVKEVYPTGDDGRCKFLAEDDKRCGIHMKYGLDALSNICVDFPVATYESADGVDFYYDPVCPSVLDALAADDGPTTITELTAPYASDGTKLRAAHSRGKPVVQLGDTRLTAAQLDRVRRTVVAALGDTTRPVWEHLVAIDGAYARLGRGLLTPETFEITWDDDPAEWMRFFGSCVGANGSGTLVKVFENYRRFVFAIPTTPESGAWDELGRHLRDFGPAWEQWLAPHEDALRPLHLRYLAHRHFAPFLTVRGQLVYGAGAITHAFATSLRYAAALGAVLHRPVDRDVMKVALGAAEYVYRSLEIPPDALPWFGLD